MAPHEYLLSDTDPDAERILVELARRTPDWKKCDQIVSAIMMDRRLAMMGLRERYPDASDDEMRRRLAALVLGRDIAIAAYNWDPEVEGY